MPRKRKNAPGTGSTNENIEPKKKQFRGADGKRQRVVPIQDTVNGPICAMQEALTYFLNNYQSLGRNEDYSNTEIAFLAILNSAYKCCTVTEIYQFIRELFPDIDEEEYHKCQKGVRHTLATVKCFTSYQPDSNPRHGTAPAKTSFKIKNLYGVAPHELVEKIATGFYRKSAAEKKEFGNGQHKWANYGPEAKKLWHNVSTFVAIQAEIRIDMIENSENPLECLNSSQIEVTAKTESFQPTDQEQNGIRKIQKCRKPLRSLNSHSISTPGQTGVTPYTATTVKKDVRVKTLINFKTERPGSSSPTELSTLEDSIEETTNQKSEISISDPSSESDVAALVGACIEKSIPHLGNINMYLRPGDSIDEPANLFNEEHISPDPLLAVDLSTAEDCTEESPNQLSSNSIRPGHSSGLKMLSNDPMLSEYQPVASHAMDNVPKYIEEPTSTLFTDGAWGSYHDVDSFNASVQSLLEELEDQYSESDNC